MSLTGGTVISKSRKLTNGVTKHVDEVADDYLYKWQYRTDGKFNPKTADGFPQHAPMDMPLKPQRTINGQKLDPRLPEPDAPLDYVPKTPEHHLGFNAEIQLANDIAAVPNMQVISYGGKTGTHGNDVVAVNKVTGDVFLYDSKWRSSKSPDKYVTVGHSTTYTKYNTRINARDEAFEKIRTSTHISEDVRQKALDNLRRGNYTTVTVARGQTRYSTIARVVGNNLAPQ